MKTQKMSAKAYVRILILIFFVKFSIRKKTTDTVNDKDWE